VTFPNGGVAGEESVVEVAVTNEGDAETAYNATLTVDGETVASESVTVGAGEATTVTLTHTFEETGEYDLSVANESTAITVYETPVEFASATQDQVDTVRLEQTATIDGTVVSNGARQSYREDSTATIQRNYTAETEYTDEVRNISLAGRTTQLDSEEWVVDGTSYTREVDNADGETTYEREPSEAFTDDETELDDEELEPYRRTDHTDEEYVFIVEAESTTDASRLADVLNQDGESFPLGDLTSIYVEYRIDRQTGRQTSNTFEVRAEDGQTFSYVELTISTEAVSFGDPVDVSVPDQVRSQATREGTTVTTGTSASLAPATNGD